MAALAKVTSHSCFAQVFNSIGNNGNADVKKILPKLTQNRSSYWGEIKNQRNFLETYAKKFNIRVPEDWGKVKTSHVIENGGNNVLSLYKNSLSRTLKFVFPGSISQFITIEEVPWQKEWFIRVQAHARGYWTEKSNQRRFLDELALKLNIENPSDWGNIVTQVVIDNGGGGLLLRYRFSLFRLLQSVYEGTLSFCSGKITDIQWKEEWFTSSHFFEEKDMKNKNHREFMDSIAKKLQIKNPKDWGLITKQEFHQMGRNFLRIYDNSLFKALQKIYPGIHCIYILDYSEIEWNREWFPNMRSKSYGYWKDKQNQKKFFDQLVKILNINEPKDWGKVTVNAVHEYGGKSLLIHYRNSLYRALCSVYKGAYYSLLW